jgi:mono/diheme cytochrome c family protein
MSFKETFFNKIFTLRRLFFLFNFAVLFLFAYALAKDLFREWKPYQKMYYKLEQKRIKDLMSKANPETQTAFKDELRHAQSHPLEIKQILAADLHRVDRCMTCHVGYDSISNPSLTNDFKEHPFAAPKNEIHAKHPFEKYGCTVCHEGQGLATTFTDAAHMPKNDEQKMEWKKKHDWHVIEFWETPMHAGPLIYASCSKCHEAHPQVPGMEIVKKGQKLSFENGCVGCHQIRGEGGTIAPDLADETSVKPLARIDFGYAVSEGLITPEERTLENWIRLHFATAPSIVTPGDPEGHLSPDPKNPQPVAPSGMPYFGFNKEETEALTAYVMSLKRESIPYTYRIPAPKEPEPKFASAIAHGRYVFQKYGCVACHGKDANSGIPVFNKQGGRAPDLVKVVGTYTKEELIKRIQTGVNPLVKENENGPTPPIYMPSFKDRIKGQELENLVAYLFSIAEKTEEW